MVASVGVKRFVFIQTLNRSVHNADTAARYDVCLSVCFFCLIPSECDSEVVLYATTCRVADGKGGGAE